MMFFYKYIISILIIYNYILITLYRYETRDGSSRSEHSEIKTDKDNNEYIVIIGQYQYIDPDGVVHDVAYTADENGFKQQDNILKKQQPVLRISPATLGSLVGGGLG